MHAATVFEIMKDDEVNVLGTIDDVQTKRQIRSVIIHTILGTDMKHHFNLISKLQEARAMYPQADSQIPFFVEDPSNEMRQGYLGGTDANVGGKRMLMLEMILHAADIGNPARPLRACKMWAERVMDEFYDQGDKEKERGLAVTFDRHSEKTVKRRVQCNFINLIVAPLYVEVIYWFPTMLELGDANVEKHAHSLQAGLSKTGGEQSGDAGALKKQHDTIKEKFDKID